MSQSCTYKNSIWFHLELDRNIFMDAHALKLSLGLLFGINNILSFGWGNSITHLSEKEEYEKM